MDKRLLTLLLVCMCATFGIQARTVKGTVVDKVNQPVIGASVHVNGTNLGAMTDVDGNFTISNAPDNAVLTFSYVGMVSKTVKAADGQMKIELADDVQNLEEVVVIGYGAAKAKDLTAPIEVVKGEKLIATPSSSPMTALQGKVAGVNIVNSGTPGDGPTVTIRGLGSFGNTTPLYVVDGMFYDNINFLNNADIQDLTIMKDASAAAIYGVRAANGVVIITTKKGAKNQDAKVTYNGYVGFQKATNVLEMCNSHEYATMLTEADKSAYSYMFENSIKNWGGNMNDLTFGADTDWYSELLRTAMITNHSLSVTGGTQKTAYAVGMSYLAQDGVMDVENYYRRLNFRASLDFDATNWLKVGFNGVFSNGDQRVPNNNAWQQAFNAPGIYPVYDTTRDSKIYTGGYASPEQIGVTNNFYNPVATANYFDSKNDTYQVLSNFYAQFQLVPDRLNFRTSYAYDYANTKGVAFTPIYCVGSVNQHNDQTSLTKSESTYKKWVWDNVLTYNQTFDKHHFNAMAGFSMRNERYYYLTATAKNVPEGKDSYKYLNLGSKEGVTVSDDGSLYRGLSYFARLGYNYADKYMLTATFRADGSSKYNEKWGYFPSVGAAWVISNEDFMADQNVLDYLKVRASWGKLGNDKIAASAGFASTKPVRGVFGNTVLDGYTYESNFSWLSWEVVNETNVGLNFATLNNRLSGDIDWYYRKTENAVISPTIPMQNTTIAGNYATILNTGVDLSLNWADKLSKDFSYNVGFNIGYLHNEVKSLLNNLNIIKGGKTVQKVGEKMNSYYGYKVIGIYQTPEECAADPIAVANKLVPGDFKYEDVNGDGAIDGRDKQCLGSYVPDVTYGFNLGFQWKALDFNISCYGQAGGELWNRKRALRYAASNYNFDRAQYENRWHGAGTSNTDPSAAALIKGWNVSDSNNASYFVESSDYFRIQNITLGYSFRNIKLGNYTLPGIRISATADRPFTTFKANSFTPELADAEGWDTQTYPLTATYTFGVQIDF